MKYYNRILLLAMVAGITVSCADALFADYKTEKPESLKKYEYLNEYGDLKTYIDRISHPDFKLGTGVTVSDFLKQDLVYTLTVNNYDDVTAGNAMKYSSCVDAKGNMDFGTVKKFVKTAKETGISIYGHTLCWHSQQQNAYLNGLIADKEPEPVPGSSEIALHIKTSKPQANVWDWELYYDLDEALIANQEYTISVRMKASSAITFPFWPGKKDGTDTQYGAGTFSAGEQWSTNTFTFTPSADIDRLRFCFGLFGGDLYFDDLTLTASGSDRNLIMNSTFEESKDLSRWSKASWIDFAYGIEEVQESGSVLTNVYILEDDFSSGTAMMGWGNNSTRQVIDGVHQMTNSSEVNPWEAQAGYDFSAPLTEGTTYFLKMKIKGSVAGSIGAVFQKPDGFAGRGDFPSIPITTEWEEVTVFTNCTGDAATRILFNYGKYVGTIYIDDLSIYWQKSGNTIPLTPEEKEEILTNELERWIKGMLESCGGYVKAWDVVNEPISGKDSDGDGYYDLQSASQTDDNGVSGENFYWQDYLGDDYARIPIKFARKYFAESGGNPDELKLFINDYNLESDWDQNKKLKSLIHWIERWESDGETKVDGIGTQMHVSYYMNPATQASKENAIINMFTLLASTGKLIKITELDMGIVDAAGETILTENLTDEMQQNMSDFYQFIIEKYFEIIPVAQQYGITHWSPTDSPSENSFWRKGQPIGLWDLNYNRKPVYVGFLEGLKNGTASK